MSTQQTLFDVGKPKPKPEPIPHSGTETSKAAAESIRPVVNRLAHEMYEFIRRRGEFGATDEEMAISLDISGSTQRPRRDRLFKAGLIRRNGKTRPFKSGRQGDVWVVTDLEPITK